MSTRKIIILGGGLVGGVMAVDLANDQGFQVAVADNNKDRLKNLANGHQIKPVQMDLGFPDEVTRLVSSFDMVISAVPGFMGFKTLQAVIEAGKNVVDISFFAEDPSPLDALARRKGVTAIMDCGVAPGMCNILIGHADNLLEETVNVAYYVGGLPRIREWPYEYKAGFSPVDVIEEYVRPARLVENGQLVVKPALSDPELINFSGIGTLEAFNTDGLRSLVHTIKARNMKEKTLRYPGHIEKIRVLRDTGFFSQDLIEVNGKLISPMEVTSRLLFPKWKMKEGEVDMTIMKIMIEGKKEGKRVRYTYDLFDTLDPVTRVHSMARTTGYTATVVARMINDGLYAHKGLVYPEYLGRDSLVVEYILKGLKERNVNYRESVKILES